MAKTYSLKVEPRSALGSRAARRLRSAGYIPAVLYGHGEETVSLKLNEQDFERALDSAKNVFELTGAGKDDTALIQDIQLNALGDRMLHIDFIRVSLTERVQVVVPVELHGEPVGVTEEEGVLTHVLHEIEVECLPTDIPDHVVVEVGDLAIDDQVTVADLQIPEEVTVLTDPEEVVAVVQPPLPEEEEEEVGIEGLAAAAEPEVIGREPEEEEEFEEEEEG